jgi:DivIVA domain-containing protein
MSTEPKFDVVLRGYDRQQVDAFILTVSARLKPM